MSTNRLALIGALRAELIRQIGYASTVDWDEVSIDGAGGFVNIDLNKLAKAVEQVR